MHRPIWPISPMILSLIWLWIGLRLYHDSNLFLHTWGLTFCSITIKLWFSRSPKVLKMIYFFNISVINALSRGSGLLLLHCISNCNAAVVHVNAEALLVSFTLQLGPLLSLLQLRCERTLKEKICGFFFSVSSLKQAINSWFMWLSNLSFLRQWLSCVSETTRPNGLMIIYACAFTGLH